ncbi:MAG: gliding motility-associated C-terminal domain-containing protein, partial [Phaeodactylibacter sp.]|nr:gliding motility-associated C-terminal domain-containing protein [Phaeodactylibacter sp.]
PYFQWQHSTDNGMNWMDIPGANDTIYTVQAPVNGDQYRLNIASSVANIGNSICRVSSEVITLEVSPVLTTDLEEMLCAGDSIQVGTSIYHLSGLYSDTLVSIAGCDSIVNLELSILPPNDTLIVDTICQGQVYLIGTTPYFSTGVFMDTLPAFNSCDSLITLDLTVLPNSDTLITTTICFGDSVVVGTMVYTDPGTYLDVIPAVNGCDSTVLLELDVYPKISIDIDTFICEGEYFFVAGNSYFEEGNYMDTLVSGLTGCDSIINLHLEVYDTAYTPLYVTICAGEIFPVGNSEYFETGQYIESLQTYLGCDSTVELNLNVLDTAFTNLEVAICEGETLAVGSSIYFNTGIYFDTLNAANGCDSVIRTDLTVNDTFSITVDEILCLGETFNGMSFENDTTVVLFLQSIHNCDSTVFVNLHISELEEVQINGDTLICEADTTYLYVASNNPTFSYAWSSGELQRIILVDEPGLYTVTVTDLMGCELTSSHFVEQVLIDAQFSSVSPTCFGFKDGSISVDTAWGGDAPYLYAINDRPPQEDPVFTSVNAGLFDITIIDDNGCSWMGIAEVFEPEAFIVELGPDINISLNDTVTLYPQFNHPVAEVSWVPAVGLTCENCPNPIASPFETTEYQIQAVDIDGCKADDRFIIKIGKIRNVYIPNAFTPNFDGTNDYFTLFGGEDVVQINRMLIFDRWGNLLFENQNMLPGDE